MSTEQKVIKHKIGLLRLAEELGNVSRACKVMGYSRDTFYRYQQAVEEGGFEALVEASRRKPNLRRIRQTSGCLGMSDKWVEFNPSTQQPHRVYLPDTGTPTSSEDAGSAEVRSC